MARLSLVGLGLAQLGLALLAWAGEDAPLLLLGAAAFLLLGVLALVAAVPRATPGWGRGLCLNSAMLLALALPLILFPTGYDARGMGPAALALDGLGFFSALGAAWALSR